MTTYDTRTYYDTTHIHTINPMGTTMKIEIRHRWNSTILFTADVGTTSGLYSVQLGLVVRQAVATRANLMDADLRDADLRGANLMDADLRGANLMDADLRGANLGGANLRDADLMDADLRGANLRSADLRGANLMDADLRDADLMGANLRGANLMAADLRGANLMDADLRDADLMDADLRGANLGDALNAELPLARTRILPEGSLIGWKKLQDGVIAKLRIPEEAKRCHAFGRKCRAEFADVLEVIGAEFGISQHDEMTEYHPGQRVMPDGFEENWRKECAPGIHFFITRIEAENY